MSKYIRLLLGVITTLFLSQAFADETEDNQRDEDDVVVVIDLEEIVDDPEEDTDQ